MLYLVIDSIKIEFVDLAIGMAQMMILQHTVGNYTMECRIK